MAEIGAFEAKTHFSKLLERVEKGEEIVITRRGKRVARLVPERPARDREAIGKTIAEMRSFARTLSLGGLKIRDLIDEGRR